LGTFVAPRQQSGAQRTSPSHKADSHREAEARHLALSLSERLERSWQLYLEVRSAAALDRRDDDPSPF
jgi:hypothetical protein